MPASPAPAAGAGAHGAAEEKGARPRPAGAVLNGGAGLAARPEALSATPLAETVVARHALRVSPAARRRRCRSESSESSGACSPLPGIAVGPGAGLRALAALPPPPARGRWPQPRRAGAGGSPRRPAQPRQREDDGQPGPPSEGWVALRSRRARVRPLCFKALWGACDGAGCPRWHPADERDAKRILDDLSVRQCTEERCRNGKFTFCPYYHGPAPAPAQPGAAVPCAVPPPKRARRGSPGGGGPISPRSERSSGQLSSESASRDGSQSDSSDEEGQSSSPSTALAAASAESGGPAQQPQHRQFLQRKDPPALLVDGPDFAVVSKPAGWDACCPVAAGSGTTSAEGLLASGWVEPLFAFPKLRRRREQHVVLSQGPIASGWALVAGSRRAQHRLLSTLREGKLISYSLALVDGEPPPGGELAGANREDGAFEASTLAVYRRKAAEGWSAQAGSERCTLVLIKAAGSACGAERGLLALAWGRPAAGDAEHGAEGGGARAFFHAYALGWSRPEGEGGRMATVVCPLPADMRAGFEGMDAFFNCPAGGDAAVASACAAERMRQALLKTGQLPAELLAEGGMVSCPTTGSFRAVSQAGKVLPMPPAPPLPFGLERWGGVICRRRWIVAFVKEALRRAKEYRLEEVAPGRVMAQTLLEHFAVLREACYNSAKALWRVADRDVSKALEPVWETMDDPRVNLSADSCLSIGVRPPCEQLQAFVEEYVSGLPAGESIPVAELFGNEHVRAIYSEAQMPHRPLLESLKPCPLFDVDPTADAITLRAVPERFLLGMEKLMRDHGIRRGDPRLFVELRKHGHRVPVSWFLGNYSQFLLGDSQAKISVAEATKMLASSQELVVEPGSNMVKSRSGHVLSLPAAPEAHPAFRRVGKEHNLMWGDRFTFSPRDVKLFQELMDHYFEPFSLQHNRMLLYTAEVETDPSGSTTWRWSVSRLMQDFKRVYTSLGGLARKTRYAFLERVCSVACKNVRFVSRLRDEELFVELVYVPDFRLPVIALCAPAWMSETFLARQEQLPPIPPSGSVLVSYALGCAAGALGSAGDAGQAAPKFARAKRHRLIIRQLLAFTADVLCVQQCESGLQRPACRSGTLDCGTTAWPTEGTLLAALVARLEKDDFEWLAAPALDLQGHSREWGSANVVFWLRRKWKAVGWAVSAGGAVSVVLEPRRSPGVSWQLTACSLEASEADLSAQLSAVKGYLRPPCILSGTFGAEAADVGRAMQAAGCPGLRSAHREVLGAELAWTSLCWGSGGSHEPSTRCRNSVWLGGGSSLTPLAALPGHKRGPHRTEDGRVCRQTMPTDHLPLVLGIEHAPPGDTSHALPVG
ncbi:unnamed protein product [Prorocentrum cordatum]|uniref:C3H1-type domain-containing protein n=1 Tax=Prorocentrum cordatum TaxID=2364126 RepID=A0ABN9UM96_9DINO|nr:unnamed protein product [Polarella glacialis]